MPGSTLAGCLNPQTHCPRPEGVGQNENLNVELVNCLAPLLRREGGASPEGRGRRTRSPDDLRGAWPLVTSSHARMPGSTLARKSNAQAKCADLEGRGIIKKLNVELVNCLAPLLPREDARLDARRLPQSTDPLPAAGRGGPEREFECRIGELLSPALTPRGRGES